MTHNIWSTTASPKFRQHYKYAFIHGYSNYYSSITFMHLADAFIKSELQYIQAIHFFISMCVPWELNPQPFALLTQCSTTEPQQHKLLKFYLHVMLKLNIIISYYNFYLFSLKLQKWFSPEQLDTCKDGDTDAYTCVYVIVQSRKKRKGALLSHRKRRRTHICLLFDFQLLKIGCFKTAVLKNAWPCYSCSPSFRSELPVVS